MLNNSSPKPRREPPDGGGGSPAWEGDPAACTRPCNVPSDMQPFTEPVWCAAGPSTWGSRLSPLLKLLPWALLLAVVILAYRLPFRPTHEVRAGCHGWLPPLPPWLPPDPPLEIQRPCISLQALRLVPATPSLAARASTVRGGSLDVSLRACCASLFTLTRTAAHGGMPTVQVAPSAQQQQQQQPRQQAQQRNTTSDTKLIPRIYHILWLGDQRQVAGVLTLRTEQAAARLHVVSCACRQPGGPPLPPNHLCLAAYPRHTPAGLTPAGPSCRPVSAGRCAYGTSQLWRLYWRSTAPSSSPCSEAFPSWCSA